MTTADYIQLSISAITLSAVIVALFGQRFWDWKDRPKIEINYDEKSDRCYRLAIVYNDEIQEQYSVVSAVSRQYYRLKIKNNGNTTAKGLKVKVELYNNKNKLADRFEPTLLSWVGGVSSVDLASGEDWYVDFLSQVTGPEAIKNRLRIEIKDKTPKGIAYDREIVSWILNVSVFGENINQVISKTFIYKPAKEYFKPGTLFNYGQNKEKKVDLP
jgi:hypothetical protein